MIRKCLCFVKKHGVLTKEKLAEKIGRENIFSAVVRLDKKTPHMHLCFTPITEDGRLTAKEIIDDSPESIIMESVLEGIAEYYSRNLAREVEKGKRENAQKGLHTGGKPPLGYDVDPDTKKLVINEQEAKAVKLIFSRILEGYSYDEVIAELNLLGYRTKCGGHFGKNSIHSLLKNEKYTGVYIYSKSAAKDAHGKRNGHAYKDEEDIIRLEDAVPVIIDKADFDLVQEKLKQRKKKAPEWSITYLLKNKMVCGECGGGYVGGRRRRGKGGIYSAYACNQRKRKGSTVCSNREISRPYIEGVVLERLAEYVFSDEYVEQVTNEYNAFLKQQSGDCQSQLKDLEKRLKDTEKQIESVLDLVLKSKAQNLLVRLDELETEKAGMERELRDLQATNPIKHVSKAEVRTVFGQIREQLTAGSLPNIQHVIDAYIHRIEVYPDEVIVIFNFFPKIRLDNGFAKKDTKKESPPSAKRELSFLDTQKMDAISGGEGTNPIPASLKGNKLAMMVPELLYPRVSREVLGK